jgi:oxaloacetate decarboxylase gamma subunit
MQSTLLDKGIELMLVGMGTVIVFLALLVVAMSALAAVIKRLTPASAEGISDEEIAAVTAAIAQHRNKHS